MQTDPDVDWTCTQLTCSAILHAAGAMPRLTAFCRADLSAEG